VTFNVSAAHSDRPAEPNGSAQIASPDSGAPNRFQSHPPADFSRFKDVPIVTVHQLKHSPPRQARKAYSKGRHYLEKQEFDEAITCLSEAVAIDPEYTAAHNDLAVVYIRRGKTDKAIPLLNSAINIDPYWGLAYFNLVIAYLSANDLSQAETTARRMAAIDAGSPQTGFVLGLSLTMENRFTTETQAALTQGEPMFPEAGLLLGRILAGRGETQAAKVKILAYLASPAVWGREMAGEWLALLDGK